MHRDRANYLAVVVVTLLHERLVAIVPTGPLEYKLLFQTVGTCFEQTPKNQLNSSRQPKVSGRAYVPLLAFSRVTVHYFMYS